MNLYNLIYIFHTRFAFVTVWFGSGNTVSQQFVIMLRKWLIHTISFVRLVRFAFSPVTLC